MKIEIVDRGPLTPSEAKLLPFFCIGMTKPQIAESIHRSTGTIRRHADNIMEKLEAHNMTEAVCKCVALGVIRITCMILVVSMLASPSARLRTRVNVRTARARESFPCAMA